VTWIEQEYRRRNPHGYWFEKDTMRFFNSQICEGVRQTGTQRIVFVTSERNPGILSGTVYPKCYSVRVMDHRGKINTVGPFCEWSKTQANKVARQMAMRDAYPGYDLAGRRVEA